MTVLPHNDRKIAQRASGLDCKMFTYLSSKKLIFDNFLMIERRIIICDNSYTIKNINTIKTFQVNKILYKSLPLHKN